MSSVDVLGPRSSLILEAARLTRRKYRDQSREFLAEGPQAVAAALDRSVVRVLYGTRDALDAHPQLSGAAHASQVPVRFADPQAMSRLSETVTPQHLVAVCGYVDVSVEQLCKRLANLKPVSFVAVLDQIQDPGNAGTVLRAADAAGADAVIFGTDSVDPYNGKCVRASAGAVFHPLLTRGESSSHTVAVLRSAGFQVLAADARAGVSVYDLSRSGELSRPTAWLFGNEARGLPPELLKQADHSVSIPIYGRAESLNLGVAAALCLYASAQSLRAEPTNGQ
ncbi:MAG: RNA methyltransferase [Acidimicrobiales bacterium]|nr:MAG: RNA methyltransferase [Acidimicrobiales bacterium]